MDTLVSLDSTASYLLSAAATLFPHLINTMTTYDSTALIVTLISLGKCLEARAKGQANKAIRKLAGLQARTAHVVRDGQELDLSIEQVQVGDELIVRPGVMVTMVISPSEAFSNAFILPHHPPCITSLPMSSIGVVLDACVLFPGVLRDTLFPCLASFSLTLIMCPS